MLTLLKYLLGLTAFVAVLILVARFVFALPEVTERVDTTALPASDSGPLADSVSRRGDGHAGLTGVAPLQGGADAFAARLLLADAAVSSIDAQYYIWHADLTGYLLLEALQRAANRGVRVRLLLDDNGTSGLDRELAALAAHPNAQVRLYNPFNLRRFKMLSYGFDFFRLNRRMHNKSFSVDGHVAILGGRNIRDEYFDTGANALFVDLDVLAVGEIVPQVSDDFDRYWSAQAVHPAGPIIGEPRGGDPISQGLTRFRDNPQMSEYREILEKSRVVELIANGGLDLEWTGVILVSDDPKKGQGAVPREDLLSSRLKQAVGRIEQRFDGVSAYFVPGEAGVRAFKTLESRRVQVRMLTNSLEATDVLPVHAGYAKRRPAMLQSGVELFELRKQAAPDSASSGRPFGSSGASLHAKTFAVDGKRIFIGSF
ncbi:MAG: phospholipase D family protein, partial [Dokdonella sp.]